MSLANKPIPTVAKGEQRSFTPNDRNNTAKLWAHSYLGGYDRPQLETALELISRMPEAHRPFHSAARVAYKKLTQALS